MEHRVLTSVNMSLNEVCWSLRELAFKVILDIGCMRSVAGVHWASALIKRWQAEGRWFRVTPEVETFKFGDGEVLKSRYRLSFVGSFGAKPVVYGFSIVDGVCPPLFSRAGCTQVGVVIDCEHHTVGARKLGIKSYGLCLDSGHYTMPVDECEPLCAELPEDFMLPKGVDVTPISSTVLQLESRPDDRSRCAGETHGLFDRERRRPEMQAVQGSPSDPRLPQHRRDFGRELRQGADAGGSGGEGPNAQEEAGRPSDTFDAEAGGECGDDQQRAHHAERNVRGPDEIQLLTTRRARAATAKTKAQARRVLTGEQADYPSLSHVWASEVALNMACSVHSRMMNEDVSVEEVLVVTEGQGGHREGDLEALEEEPEEAESVVQPRDSLLLRPLRGDASEAEHGGAGHSQRPSRGLTQKLKAGLIAGKEAIQLLSNVVADTGHWILLEVFSGTALTQCAKDSGKWKVLASVDRIRGWGLTRRQRWHWWSKSGLT